MHRCLTIAEVQRTIFHEVQPKDATLARLARTCRTFNNTALDILWETLPSIKYLIQCLPTDLWKVSVIAHSSCGEIGFQRAMSDSDWEIFFRYSSRIRSLYSFLSPFSGYIQCGRVIFKLSLHIDVVTALSQPPNSRPLVPNLKTLDWSEEEEKYAPLLQSLLTRSLVNLSLPSFALQSTEMLVDPIIRCPLLKNLYVCDGRSELQEISSEALMHPCSLESFRCYTLTLNETAITNLSKFPSLVHLDGRLKDDLQSEKVRPYLIPPTFQTLASLTLGLRGNQLSTLTSLLEVMRLSLREVSLTLGTLPTLDMLYLFFFTLANVCNPERLSHIVLITLYDYDTLHEDRPRISLSTFKPLLTLPNVKLFTLDVDYDVDLDDDAIKVLTKHWPKLTSISFNASYGWGIESGVTHRGLITLLSRCTSLTDIGLAVDFSGVDLPLYSIPSSRLGNEITSRCERAHFVSSTIEHPFSIAAFLSDICPRLIVVMSFWNENNEPEVEWETDDRLSVKWDQVRRFLPGFLAVRRQYAGVSGGRDEA